jgi:hypothetical protein
MVARLAIRLGLLERQRRCDVPRMTTWRSDHHRPRAGHDRVAVLSTSPISARRGTPWQRGICHHDIDAFNGLGELHTPAVTPVIGGVKLSDDQIDRRLPLLNLVDCMRKLGLRR